MIRSSITLLFFLVLSQSAFSQASYIFDNQEIKPGTKKHFLMPITAGHDTTSIPVTVFNGSRDGKTLGITAGVHGYEYAPILAGQRLIKSIDPKKLTCVVILVHVANLESFVKRSPFVNPIDNKNLNRSFPGKADGTITDKVALFITDHIISKSDYFLDMHSGDAPEDLRPYSAYYSHMDKPQISAVGKAMTVAMGFDYIVDFNTNGKDYMQKDQLSLYCSAEAFKRGIPAADIECGRLGMVEHVLVSKIENGVLNMLGHLKMQSLTGRKSATGTPKIIANRTYIEAKNAGLFYAEKKAGDFVKKGMTLGYITDFFGAKLNDVYADVDGLILMIINTPPINAKEDLAVIGEVAMPLKR